MRTYKSIYTHRSRRMCRTPCENDAVNAAVVIPGVIRWETIAAEFRHRLHQRFPVSKSRPRDFIRFEAGPGSPSSATTESRRLFTML